LSEAIETAVGFHGFGSAEGVFVLKKKINLKKTGAKNFQCSFHTKYLQETGT
jgi:hypothetical protein